MYFLLYLFGFLLVLDYTVFVQLYKYVPCDNLTFNGIALGHSGALITWEPIGTKCDFSCNILRFIHFHIEKDTEGKKTSENSGSVLNMSNSCEGQYKINGLDENTSYKIEIELFGQHQQDFPNQRKADNYGINYTYTVKMRTNIKTNSIPAKPFFNYVFNKNSRWTKIRWYPCDKGRNCRNNETGTHFGLNIREIDGRRRSTEMNKEVLLKDYAKILFWPGRIYEVVGYSINGKSKTFSDPEEIFIKPVSTPVQHIHILSLPDSSILISWNDPKHTLEAYNVYYEILHYDSTKNYADEMKLVLFQETYTTFRTLDKDVKSIIQNPMQQKRIHGLKHGIIYHCVIYPLMFYDRPGIEFRMEHTLQDYDENLKIARPDFIHTESKDLISGGCWFFLRWLPCGQSFDCKNTKPGSNFSWIIEPEISKEKVDMDYYSNGYIQCIFDKDQIYRVTVRSSIGKNFSKPVTKTFKNCLVYQELH